MKDGRRGKPGRGDNQSRATPLLPGTGIPASDALPAVRIRRPARSVTQSGPGRRRWVLEFEPTGRRPIDPLMGWTGTDDTLAQARLEFRNLQGAIDFAEKQGWRYEVAEPPARRYRPKNYAEQLERDIVGPSQRLRSRKGVVPVADRGASGRPESAIGRPRPGARLLRRIRSKRPGRNRSSAAVTVGQGPNGREIRRRGSGASQSCPDHSRDGLPRLADRAPREEG